MNEPNIETVFRTAIAGAESPLAGSMARFAAPNGRSLLARTEDFFRWQDHRRSTSLWPYSRTLVAAPRTEGGLITETGVTYEGVNFASQDYLSLSSHPEVHEAVKRALRDFGPHSAGSPVLIGNTTLSLQLESAIAELLDYEEVVLFPTGWAAGFGVIAGLVRPHDHVILDRLAHACLQQGAAAATRNVVRCAHLDLAAVEAALKTIRATDANNAILVVSEGLFSMDSDVPDVRRLQEICRTYDSTLLVDVAHDLGAMGPGGTGSIGAQGLLGEVDLVMGSFSKTFASNGGFVATNSAAVKQFLKFYGGPHIFSNALSPLQAAAALAAIQIVRSAEGDSRRASLMAAVDTLRASLRVHGIETLGVPSPIVPAVLSSESTGRIASALLQRAGVFANLVEYPAVPVGRPRFRLQVMADHTADQARKAASAVSAAVVAARDLERDLPRHAA